MASRHLVLGAAGRRLPWPALAGAAAASAIVTWTRATTVDAGRELVPMIRLAGVLIAAAAAGSLEDTSEPLSDTLPFGRRRRRAVTVGLTAVVAVAAWCSIVAVAIALSGGSPTIPVAALLVEATALQSVGWMLAAVLIRRGEGRGAGLRAGVALLALVGASLVHPRSLEWLWAGELGSPLTGTGGHWMLVGAVAVAGLCTLSADPAGRGSSWPVTARRHS